MAPFRLLISFALILLVCGISAASASAAHYYLQMESGQEFKQITSTVEATVSSNVVIGFRPLGSKLEELSCHVLAKQKLKVGGEAGGEGEITEFSISSCNTKPLGCVVSLAGIPLPVHTVLTEPEKGVYRELLTDFDPTFKVSSCLQEGLYSYAVPNALEGEISNELGIEVNFPKVKLKGTKLGEGEVFGRWKLTPLIGHQLRVGP